MQGKLEEDWLLDSLEKYEGIYMFELQYPTFCLEWDHHATAVWVVCRSEGQSEIMQLALPERLLPPETQSLWAKRDFKMVCGVLTKSSVTSLKTLVSEECIVTANSEAKLKVWTRSKQSPDLLEETEELRLWPTTTSSLCGDILLDTSRSHPSLVLAGSTHSFNSLRLVDLTSKDTIFLPQLPEKDDQSLCIHYCSFLPVADSSKQLVTCSGRGGQIDLWDWRVNPGQAVITLPPLANQFFQSPLAYSLAASGLGMTPSSSGSVQLARLAASGWLDLFDTRYPARVLASATCSGTSSSSSSCSSGGCGRQDFSAASTFTRFSQGGDHPLPCVKYSSSSSYVLSTSGVHPGVSMYNTSTWSQEMSEPPPILFAHHGHEMECKEANVLTHSWQPTQTLIVPVPGIVGGTVLSTDSQGSLHAWQWKHKQ